MAHLGVRPVSAASNISRRAVKCSWPAELMSQGRKQPRAEGRAREPRREVRRAVEAADTAEAKVAKQARPQKSSEEREQGRTARRKAIADAGAAKTQAHQAASREKVEAFSLPLCGVCLLCGCRWFIL